MEAPIASAEPGSTARKAPAKPKAAAKASAKPPGAFTEARSASTEPRSTARKTPAKPKAAAKPPLSAERKPAPKAKAAK
jgi:hypothetical protein